MSEAFEKLLDTLELLSKAGEYKPEPAEARSLSTALQELLSVYAKRGFAEGEEAQWSYRGVLGNWDLILRPAPPSKD
jgi:hypothetical protein